jgi:2-polyprenyl-3-methyl-5-hydroxy-6-metoxy-1,4-benzoquinol methylase
MASKYNRFRFFYWIGFTPWEGHPLAQALLDLIEGTSTEPALTAGSALDIGCGTGDAAIYLAQHGWKVTAIDYLTKPLDKAQAKASAAQVSIDFLTASVTHLSQAGIDQDFDLIVDNGCIHNISAADRDAYVREVGAIASPHTRLLITAFLPGGRIGVPGISLAEIENRFTPRWTLLSTGATAGLDRNTPTRYYLLQSRS